MIRLKTKEEILRLKAGGKILAAVLRQVASAAKPGIRTIDLDSLAEELIEKAGGKPSFKNYGGGAGERPFPATLCTSINNEVVHGVPSARQLQSGDVISLDVGMEYDGFYTDTAMTIAIGKVPTEVKKLIKVTKKCLELGIKKVKPGNYIDDISRAVQEQAEKNGFSVVKDLVGHGVGFAVHEDPRVPNFLTPNQAKVKLVPGLVIAIEPMINLGGEEVGTLDDGWTVVTVDGEPSAHFEHSVAVTEKGCIILTE